MPVTDPLTAPVMVGAPPLEISRAWLNPLVMPPVNTTQNRIKILKVFVFISYGAVIVNVTATVVLPFS